MVNVPLLRKMVDRVTLDMKNMRKELSTVQPGDHYWDQMQWIFALNKNGYRERNIEITEQGAVGSVSRMACGTAACLAGETFLQTAPIGSKYNSHAAEVKVPGKEWMSINSWAADELGLSDYQASQIFFFSNSAERIRELANKFIQEAEEAN